MNISTELYYRAETYLAARRAQELDHTDTLLNWQRQDAHDELMLMLDMENIEYADRGSAALLAEEITEGAPIDHQLGGQLNVNS